jgi:hypothetical protein
VNYWLSGDAAESLDGAVTVRITDSGGALVKEFTDDDAGPGFNRAVWDLRWAGAEPIPGEEGGGGFFFGNSGPPAVPGTYTATLVVDGEERSTSFELRGDPNVNATQADYVARYEAAVRARDLQTRMNRMVGAMGEVNTQIDGLLEAVEGKDMANEDRIRETAELAKEALTTLEAEVRRPEGSMNYRDWPRLAEQLRFVVRGIEGAQARPTDGQLEVLTEVETAAAERAEELDAIMSGLVGDLNSLLEDAPRIMTDWRRVIS